MRHNRYGGHPPCPKCGDERLVELVAFEVIGTSTREIAFYVCNCCSYNWSVLERDEPPVKR